jgi:hypothetical protein
MEDQERRSIMGGAGISRRALLGAAAASCGALTFRTPFVGRALAEEPGLSYSRARISRPVFSSR